MDKRNAWGRTFTCCLRQQYGNGAMSFDPKSDHIIGIYLGEMLRRLKTMGEDAVKSFWPSDFGANIYIMKFTVDFGGCQSTTACNNQPNKRGRNGGGIGEDA